MRFKHNLGVRSVQGVLAAVERVEQVAREHCAVAWKEVKPWTCQCVACRAVRIPGTICDCSIAAEHGHQRGCPVTQGLRDLVLHLQYLLNPESRRDA